VSLALSATPAQATMAPTLHLPANCTKKDAADDVTTTFEKPYWFCDDGVPMAGGTNPNVGGLSAITVPAKYGAPPATFDDLPLKAGDAAAVAGADPGTGDIALDVDISLPDAAPSGSGYPVVFMMHGCCSGNKTSWEAPTLDSSGEKWHYNNAWFAARGYVVVTYTARGFVGAQPTNRGSTGETQLDSRSYEINDFQALACNVFAEVDGGAFEDVDGHAGLDEIDPSRMVVTGGSYGGGFAWLAATDPTWSCTADTPASGQPMSLAAAAPRYGWTDLAYTLVPNGTHMVRETDPITNTQGCADGPVDLDGMSTCSPPLSPVGVPKRSIVTALYSTGNSAGDHTTFPPSITADFTCLTSTYPAEGNPLCTNTLSTSLPEFIRERSAYYQNHWFNDIGSMPSQRVPIYNAATFSDPLFPSYENRRMAKRIRAVEPSYPIKQYYGDYQHFVQNKAKEWGDLCLPDRRVCQLADYPGGNLNADPPNLVAGPAGTGVTTRLNKFIDNYALPAGGFGAVPANVTPDVTASLQICDAANPEPGERITTDPASSNFDALAPNTLTVNITGNQTTTSTVPGNSHATAADPLGNLLFNGGRCPSHAGPNSVAPEVGVASYTSDALAGPATMIGSTRVTVDFDLTGGTTDGLQLNARLYDVAPDGSAKMVDRGPRRITPEEEIGGQVVFDLHGNGWRFPTGHRVRVELAQDDEPFVKRTDVPSSMTLSHLNLVIPTVEASTTAGGTADPKPSVPQNPSTPASSSSPAPSTPRTKCKTKKKGKKGLAAAKCKKKKKKKR
jgi:dienelactone hydrolase